jgi:hypothetical protein
MLSWANTDENRFLDVGVWTFGCVELRSLPPLRSAMKAREGRAVTVS